MTIPETGYLAIPPNASEIGLWATATPGAKEPARAHLDLRIRAQDVMLLRAGDRFRGERELTRPVRSGRTAAGDTAGTR